MFGFTDEPRSKKSEDQFQVERYINGLSHFIRSCSTPMTIAIQGDWGSGKTSIMNMVMDELDGHVIPVWFNTWQYSQFDMGDKLPFALLSNLISTLAPSVSTSEAKAVVTTLATIVLDRVAGSKAAECFEKLVEDDEQTSSQAVGKLKEQFQKYIEKVCESKNRDRVVIFVDDLDRLQPTRAVELLEVLKLFLDCNKCVFVLAIDYEVVSRGIEQKFGLNDRAKSRSFFDKIIQVPFKMPVAQYDLNSYVHSVLAELEIPVSDEGHTHYLDLIRRSVGYNPRSMKRLFNVFSLLDCIQQNTQTDWDRGMLFAVLCLQLAYEEVYNFLAEHRDDLSAALLNGLLTGQNEDTPPDEDVAALLEDEGPEAEELAEAQAFLDSFIQFISPEDPDNLEKLQAVLGLSAITATGGHKRDSESRKKGTRYEKEFDAAYQDIPISEPIEKTNKPDGWNGADLQAYTLFEQDAPTPVKNFNDLMSQVLETLYARNPERFRVIMAEPDSYFKLRQLFRGAKKGGSGFINAQTLSFGPVETSTNYNDKVKQLRSLMSAMGYDPAQLKLRLKLAHRKG